MIFTLLYKETRGSMEDQIAKYNKSFKILTNQFLTDLSEIHE